MQSRLPRHSFHVPHLLRGFHYTPTRSAGAPDFVPQSRRDSAQAEESPKNKHGTIFHHRFANHGGEALLQQDFNSESRAKQTFTTFDLSNRVYIVTGGARGLGLAMAEALAEAGGEVYCFDRNEQPNQEYHIANEQLRREAGAGVLHYRCIDVSNIDELEALVTSVAGKKQRLDGLIAAAGMQQISPALEYNVKDARRMLDTNFIGVLATANACARQMFRYRCRGSMCLVASMSGLIANKGLLSPVYNASKAAVIQLARNLSMEWSKVQPNGQGGLRVNALSPGHVVTPMVKENFTQAPGLKEEWEAENMMGRLAEPSEFKGAGLFLLSNASSFMTGNNLVIDGGHTAW